MASTFTFYRPRGVPRNYIVEITIEQQPDDEVKVSVSHNRPVNCGHCGHQHPEVQGTGTKRKLTYVIGDGNHPVPMIPDDTITIEVSVPKVVPKQKLIFTATDTGFTCEPQPFKLDNKQVWQPHEIAFQKIAIIDQDNQEVPEHVLSSPVLDRSLERERRIQSYVDTYPYLEKNTIENLVRGFTVPNGTCNWNGLEEVLRQNNTDAEKKAKPKRQLTAQLLRKYPHLTETIIETQVQRFTRPSGVINEARLHEVLKEVNEAAKLASGEQAPLLQRQVEEILART